jgi:hypothetical protein
MLDASPLATNAPDRTTGAGHAYEVTPVTIKDFNNLAGALESLAVFFAIVIGGYWTYKTFVRQREGFPFVDFKVDINIIGKHGDQWILELIAYIRNSGKVQHKFETLAFDLNTLSGTDALRPEKEFGGQTFFPTEAITGSWLPQKSRYFFVEPGVQAKYSFITHVDESAEFLMLHGWFSYQDNKTGHTAERTVRLPKPEASTSEDQQIAASDARPAPRPGRT